MWLLMFYPDIQLSVVDYKTGADAQGRPPIPSNATGAVQYANGENRVPPAIVKGELRNLSSGAEAPLLMKATLDLSGCPPFSLGPLPRRDCTALGICIMERRNPSRSRARTS